MKKEKIMTGSKGDTRGTKNDRSILKGAAQADTEKSTV